MSDIVDRKAELDRSIAALYQTFAPYEFTDRIGDAAFPGLCDPTEMLAHPLAQVPPSAFKLYSWKAVTTWGSVDDLKHFLPRLLEQAIAPLRDFTDHLDPTTIFGKLAYSRWSTWPELEKDVVAAFLHAIWAYVVAVPPRAVSDYTSFPSADECLDAIDAATNDAAPFLDKLLHDATSGGIHITAAAHIAWMVLDSANRLSLKGSARRHGAAFDQWLQSQEIADCLQAALLDSPQSEYVPRHF